MAIRHRHESHSRAAPFCAFTGDRMIRGVGAIVIGVRDIERSIVFYRDVLGLPLWPGAGQFAAFEVGSTTLLLSEGHWDILGARSSSGILIALNVTDLDHARRILGERGVSFASEPFLADGARVIRFLDPDGHLLSLVESPRPARLVDSQDTPRAGSL